MAGAVDIEKIEHLITDLERQVETTQDWEDRNFRSWGYESGVLLTVNQAIYLITVLNELRKEKSK